MKGEAPKPIETPELDYVLAFPATCGYGRVVLASLELIALKRELETYREELECCASTFAIMGGSGPAHASRIRRKLTEPVPRVVDREPEERGRCRICGVSFPISNAECQNGHGQP